MKVALNLYIFRAERGKGYYQTGMVNIYIKVFIKIMPRGKHVQL